MAARRALLLAMRARGAMRAHSSSRSQRFLRALSVLLLLVEACLLLFQPAGVVALERIAAAAIEFENPLGDVVEEVAVVRDGDDRARVLLQMVFEPLDGLGVEVVGRLVEQQQIGLLQERLAERDAPAFAAGELFDRRVAGRQPHRVHRDFELAVEVVGVLARR